MRMLASCSSLSLSALPAISTRQFPIRQRYTLGWDPPARHRLEA